MSRHRDRLAAWLAARASRMRPEAAPGMCPDPNLLAAYQDRALEPEEAETLERHAASCEACHKELAALARLAFRLDFPGTNPQAVSAAPRVPRSWLIVSSAAAVLAAALLLAPRFGIHFLGEPEEPASEIAADPLQPDPPAVIAAATPVSTPSRRPERRQALPTPRDRKQQPGDPSAPTPHRQASRQRELSTPTPQTGPAGKPRPESRASEPDPMPTTTPPPEPSPTPLRTAGPVNPDPATPEAMGASASGQSTAETIQAEPNNTAAEEATRLSFKRNHLMTPGVTAAQRYSNLAVRFYLDGDSARALKYLESALHRDGRLSEACFNLALLYEENGRHHEAARQWGRYVALAPDSPQTPLARRRLEETRSR